MFFHIFKYKLKELLRVKEAMFWTLLFPVILSTLFYFAFGNLSSNENMVKVKVAVISSQIQDDNLIDAINDSKLFDISEGDEFKAKELLKNGDIKGYISENDGFKMTVKKTGLQESILNTFLNEYSQVNSTITTLYKINPEGVSEEFLGSLSEEKSFITKVPVSKSNDTNVVYFYALLAMTCLMAATNGVYCIINIQANQSDRAVRQSVAPSHKMKIFLGSLCANLTVQFSSILIVLGYISFILKVDFGNSMGYVVILSLVGTFTGITLGTAISSLTKVGENVKIGIVTSVIMLFSFLAGLMSTDIKYIVQTKFPPISYINPANLITDGFLSLYYYNSHTQCLISIGVLAGMSLVFSAITYMVLRRQKYASI